MTGEELAARGAPKRIWACIDPYGGRFLGLATIERTSHYVQEPYILATPGALAKSPEVQALVKAAAPKMSASDFDCLILDAISEAAKAMRKFPQPNYVISLRKCRFARRIWENIMTDDELIAENAQLRADIAAAQAREKELLDELGAFLSVWAVEYARRMMFKDGELHPQHYDRMAELGVRMVDFRRAALASAPAPEGGSHD